MSKAASYIRKHADEYFSRAADYRSLAKEAARNEDFTEEYDCLLRARSLELMGQIIRNAADKL